MVVVSLTIENREQKKFYHYQLHKYGIYIDGVDCWLLLVYLLKNIEQDDTQKI